MKSLNSIELILWDFDGVILDSMHVRDQGFVEIFKDYPQEQVDDLLTYHRTNGGLSRYVKIRYFFNEIRNEPISDEQVMALAAEFSVIMKRILCDENLLIADSCQFIAAHAGDVPMYIVSGSDQTELRYLCEQLSISQHFKGIFGSPTPKTELVAAILQEKQPILDKTVLIGDSVNDYEAASKNQVGFLGYNNPNLKGHGNQYIESFDQLAIDFKPF